MRIKSLLIFILLSIFSKSIGIKIFVYDLPKRFNAEILEQNQQQLDTYPQRFSMGREEWNCLHNMFRTEITFHQKLMESEFRTTNPEDAEFFYVPIYTVCRMNLNLPFDLKSSVTKSVSFHRDLLEYITQSYPYWNRSQGRDHLFLVAQGLGAKLLGPDIYNTATILTVNSDTGDEAFNSDKDISIPPDLFAVPPPFVPYQYRRYEAFFGGSIGLWKNPNYSKAPEGIFAFTPRISESIMSGCIPVIISDTFEPPFSSKLDYDEFSVRVSMDDLPNLPQIIKNIPIEQVTQKLDRVQQISSMFTYNSPPQFGDALYQIVQQLENKK